MPELLRLAAVFKRNVARRLAGVMNIVFLCWLTIPAFASAGEGEDLFENSIRPLLANRCFECHGPKKQWASLRLDSPAGLNTGGDSGPAIVAGKPDQSELLTRVTATDDSRMPPEDSGKPLTAAQIRDLTRWIELGASWPDAPSPPDLTEVRQREHWAFQPVVRPEVPGIDGDQWSKNPIDHFILRKLKAAELEPSPQADRRTLIRRVYYDLIGLPPTPEEVAAFVADDAPDAYEKLVDRLLASPRYGEKWGRHWLDLARYSDTKGYVYAREQRFFVHSTLYRDWVIQAFNDDLPYDRFVLLQLAADQVAEDERDLAAMGLLTLGRRFLGVNPDIFDDRIDVIGRGLLGLTIGCARCHDHKYDPIPTRDYYSLYGVFQNCSEVLEPIPRAENAPPLTEEMQKKLAGSKQKQRDYQTAQLAEASQRVRNRIDEYLLAQRELHEYPDVAFSQLLKKEDLIPATVWRWQNYLKTARETADPIFAPYWAFAELPAEQFSASAAKITAELQKPDVKIHPRVAPLFKEPPQSPADLAQRYAQLFQSVDRQWQALCAAATQNKQPLPEALPDADDEALRQVIYGPNSPCEVPDEPVVNIEYFFDIGTTTALWKHQNEIDQVVLQSPHAAPHVTILRDRPSTVEARVFRRGNSEQKGEVVPRQFLKILSGEDRRPFQQGSGRLELAQAIVDPKNPLTARVWVNRVWMNHFGAGLVDTPSDFGLRANPPSHAELLDWLASELVEQGWSTKRLHQMILLSATYQQQSRVMKDTVAAKQAMQRDPGNRLLWHRSATRLSFEQFRDTLAALSGSLDLTAGGDAMELFPSGGKFRRSVYGKIDRQYLPNILRVFDFANPDLHTPQRGETTSPQQALFALNHPFVAQQAKLLTANLSPSENESLPEDFVAQLYQTVLQRSPSAQEQEQALAFLGTKQPGIETPSESATSLAWTYGYGALDEQGQKVKTFEPLPYTATGALQGGPNFPDAKLGWAQLTAKGGHPGNDLQHAVIRRWTAPKEMSIAVESLFIHEPTQGDGVRYHVLSSQRGQLATGAIHKDRRTINLEIQVAAGEQLDFVVDIGGTLAYDQFLWSPTITERAVAGSDSTPITWNAELDFPAGPAAEVLSPKEQLAQLLLISNELMFVD